MRTLLLGKIGAWAFGVFRLLLGLAVVGVSLFEVELLWGAESLPRLENTLLSRWLQANFLQARLHRGRVEWSAQGPSRGGSRLVSGGIPREQISVFFPGSGFTIRYEYQDRKQTYAFSLEADGSFEVRWQSLQPASSEKIEFWQKPRQPVVLKTIIGASERAWKGASLWHLAFESPETVQKYIIPLFSPFLPSVSLLTQTAQVEAEMLQLVRLHPTPDRARWEALVAQLADEQYTRREAADRALRQQGSAIVSFLRSLDWSRLDAEQRFRIRRILQELDNSGAEDSPAKAAYWLLEDPEIWWILLDRPDVQTRRIAAQRLAQLLGQSIDFDPEAPLELRQAQRQRLEDKVRPALGVPPPKP